MKSHSVMKIGPALASVIAVIAIASACGGGAPGPEAAAGDSQAMGDITLLNYDLGSALGSPARTGNTCGAYNQWTPPCASSSASDNTFWWTAPYSGTFNFNTFSSSYDTVLHVYNRANSALLGCNDDAGGTLQSSVSLSLAGGQQIMIVVDGYSTRCGGYSLNIAFVSPPSGYHWSLDSTENCYDMFGGSCYSHDFSAEACPPRPVQGKACSVEGDLCWSVASSTYVQQYMCVPN